MSREILFKAKRKNWKERSRELWWVEGYLYRLSERLDPFIMLVDRKGEAYEVNESTICQYNGLADKNNQKIWENDIVTNGRHIGIVRYGWYDLTHLGFYIEWMNGDEALRVDFLFWVSRIWTIGNIFDSPELLEGGAE